MYNTVEKKSPRIAITKTKRFLNLYPPSSGSLGPGQYHLTDDFTNVFLFRKNKNKKYLNSKPKDSIERHINRIRNRKVHIKGSYLSMSQRFREEKFIVPGPGKYGDGHIINHDRTFYYIYRNKKCRK